MGQHLRYTDLTCLMTPIIISSGRRCPAAPFPRDHTSSYMPPEWRVGPRLVAAGQRRMPPILICRDQEVNAMAYFC